MPSNSNSSVFTEYAKKIRKEISLLEKLEYPSFNSWIINWKLISEIENIANKKDWYILDVYEDLYLNKSNPAIYYFSIEEVHSEKIFTSFLKSKSDSSSLRREQGVSVKGFHNISHVRRKFEKTNCLYVGSTRVNIHERFKQHLGFSSGRTGALYLSKVFADNKKKPRITFNYFILDKRYLNLTEHIESIFYDTFQPLLGKRPLREFK